MFLFILVSKPNEYQAVDDMNFHALIFHKQLFKLSFNGAPRTFFVERMYFDDSLLSQFTLFGSFSLSTIVTVLLI